MDDAPDWLEIKQFYFESDQCMVLESIINHSKPPQRRKKESAKKEKMGAAGARCDFGLLSGVARK